MGATGQGLPARLHRYRENSFYQLYEYQNDSILDDLLARLLGLGIATPLPRPNSAAPITATCR